MAHAKASIGSYGGMPIQSCEHELDECERNDLDPTSLGEANSFSIGLGAEPGRGFILMVKEHVDLLTRNAQYQLDIGIEDNIDEPPPEEPDPPLVPSPTPPEPPPPPNPKLNQFVSLANIIFLRATHVYPGDTDHPNALMLVEITDIRHWLGMSFIDACYNIPKLPYEGTKTLCGIGGISKEDYITSSLRKVGSNQHPWTISEILRDIWSHMPLLPSGESLSPTTVPYPILPDGIEPLGFQFASERHQYNCIPVLDAYCLCLKRLGAQLSYDPIDNVFRTILPGKFALEKYTPDLTELNLLPEFDKLALSKEETIYGRYSDIPSSVRVCFTANYPDQSSDAFHTRPFYTVVVQTADWITSRSIPVDTVIPIPNTTNIIYGDMDARFPSTPDPVIETLTCIDPSGANYTGLPQLNVVLSTPVNSTKLNLRAKELAYTHLDKLTTTDTTKTTYSGCLPLRHSGDVCISRISWYAQGDGWLTDVEFERTSPQFHTPPTDLRVRDLTLGKGGKIWFKVIEISHYYWTTPGCEYVKAVVTQVACDTTAAKVGDEVLVFDPMFCWFNLPIVLMMRLNGTATLSSVGQFNLQVCGQTPTTCFWAVDSVCCLEETYA